MKTLKRKTWLIVMAIVSVCLNLTACSSNDEKEDDFTAKGKLRENRKRDHSFKVLKSFYTNLTIIFHRQERVIKRIQQTI